MPPKKQLTPDITLVNNVLPTDTEEILRQRAYSSLPRIIADLGRQSGEAAWRDMPMSKEMPAADKARLIRETGDAYQKNLTQREMYDILEEVVERLLAKRGDGTKGPGHR